MANVLPRGLAAADRLFNVLWRRCSQNIQVSKTSFATAISPINTLLYFSQIFANDRYHDLDINLNRQIHYKGGEKKFGPSKVTLDTFKEAPD